MIYDTPIELLRLPDNAGAPLGTKLIHVSAAYCGELTVFSRRFWDAIQAGSRIDVMVELPLRRAVTSGMYCLLWDHVYRIEQAQFDEDSDGLPVTRLSLMQMEGSYDIARP